jgi:hypothetical protein
MALIDNHSSLITGPDRLKERSSVMSRKKHLTPKEKLDKLLEEFPFLFSVKQEWNSEKDAIKIRYANKVVQCCELIFPATFADCFPYGREARNHVKIFVYCHNPRKQGTFPVAEADDYLFVPDADTKSNVAKLVLEKIEECDFQPKDVKAIILRYQWYDNGKYDPDFMADEIEIFKPPHMMTYVTFLKSMSTSGVINSWHWSEENVLSHQL